MPNYVWPPPFLPPQIPIQPPPIPIHGDIHFFPIPQMSPMPPMPHMLPRAPIIAPPVSAQKQCVPSTKVASTSAPLPAPSASQPAPKTQEAKSIEPKYCAVTTTTTFIPIGTLAEVPRQEVGKELEVKGVGNAPVIPTKEHQLQGVSKEPGRESSKEAKVTSSTAGEGSRLSEAAAGDLKLTETLKEQSNSQQAVAPPPLFKKSEGSASNKHNDMYYHHHHYYPHGPPYGYPLPPFSANPAIDAIRTPVSLGTEAPRALPIIDSGASIKGKVKLAEEVNVGKTSTAAQAPPPKAIPTKPDSVQAAGERHNTTHPELPYSVYCPHGCCYFSHQHIGHPHHFAYKQLANVCGGTVPISPPGFNYYTTYQLGGLPPPNYIPPRYPNGVPFWGEPQNHQNILKALSSDADQSVRNALYTPKSKLNWRIPRADALTTSDSNIPSPSSATATESTISSSSSACAKVTVGIGAARMKTQEGTNNGGDVNILFLARKGGKKSVRFVDCGDEEIRFDEREREEEWVDEDDGGSYGDQEKDEGDDEEPNSVAMATVQMAVGSTSHAEVFLPHENYNYPPKFAASLSSRTLPPSNSQNFHLAYVRPRPPHPKHIAITESKCMNGSTSASAAQANWTQNIKYVAGCACEGCCNRRREKEEGNRKEERKNSGTSCKKNRQRRKHKKQKKNFSKAESNSEAQSRVRIDTTPPARVSTGIVLDSRDNEIFYQLIKKEETKIETKQKRRSIFRDVALAAFAGGLGYVVGAMMDQRHHRGRDRTQQKINEKTNEKANKQNKTFLEKYTSRKTNNTFLKDNNGGTYTLAVPPVTPPPAPPSPSIQPLEWKDMDTKIGMGYTTSMYSGWNNLADVSMDSDYFSQFVPKESAPGPGFTEDPQILNAFSSPSPAGPLSPPLPPPSTLVPPHCSSAPAAKQNWPHHYHCHGKPISSNTSYALNSPNMTGKAKGNEKKQADPKLPSSSATSFANEMKEKSKKQKQKRRKHEKEKKSSLLSDKIESKLISAPLLKESSPQIMQISQTSSVSSIPAHASSPSLPSLPGVFLRPLAKVEYNHDCPHSRSQSPAAQNQQHLYSERRPRNLVQGEGSESGRGPGSRNENDSGICNGRNMGVVDPPLRMRI